jgi:hypothetical protein
MDERDVGAGSRTKQFHSARVSVDERQPLALLAARLRCRVLVLLHECVDVAFIYDKSAGIHKRGNRSRRVLRPIAGEW